MRTGTVIAATLIRAAPAGFEPGYVVALIDTDGARELHRLDGSHGAPTPGTVVSLGRAQPRFSSAAVVSPPTGRI